MLAFEALASAVFDVAFAAVPVPLAAVSFDFGFGRRLLCGRPLAGGLLLLRLRVLLLLSHQSLSEALPAPEWARKVRVGANSPSLWPTIDSET